MTTAKDNVSHELNSLSVGKRDAIKVAYYKAAEGLRALADELEAADLELRKDDNEERSELLALHLEVCAALDAMQSVSVLGQLL